jgi:hypothetical protein
MMLGGSNGYIYDGGLGSNGYMMLGGSNGYIYDGGLGPSADGVS